MCLLVALDVLQKKYEKFRFFKFNLLQKKKGRRLNANAKICFCFASYHMWWIIPTVVAVDSGHSTSKSADFKFVAPLHLD